MRGSRCALGLALCIWGCSAAPVELPWKVTTADEEIVATARTFEAEIRRGTCDGPILHREVFVDDPSPPPSLAPGDYAFVVRARDAACALVGEGCVQLALPTDEECVEVELTASSGGCASGASCVDGRCVVADAAVPDATVADSAADSTTRPDTAVVDSTVDTSLTDAGCASDLDCDDENRCTDDRCIDGRCANPANAATCDDGLFCNGAERCGGAVCISPGNPCAGLCSEMRAACGSDCDFFSSERGCIGGSVISAEAMATLAACEAYCEDASFADPVDCCDYDGSGICRAHRDTVTIGVTSMTFAASCSR